MKYARVYSNHNEMYQFKKPFIFCYVYKFVIMDIAVLCNEAKS
jgi:hypothetical protein